MAMLLISSPAQSSSLPAAACRSAADRARSHRFQMHLKHVHTCGNAWHAHSRIARFGQVYHVVDVNTPASHYRSALVRVLMRVSKVVPCFVCICRHWLIVFTPHGDTSKSRVTALRARLSMRSGSACRAAASHPFWNARMLQTS